MAKHRRLDRATVVAKAAELANEMGSVQEVTLTTLAAALDVRVPSLYNHIGGLDDLHAALAFYALEKLLAHLRIAASGEVGIGALTRVATGYRRFARAYPGIYPLTLRAPAADDMQMQALAKEVLQFLLLILASLGLHREDALHAVRGLRAVLHGFVSLEAVESFQMPLELDESFNRLIDAYLMGLESISTKR